MSVSNGGGCGGTWDQPPDNIRTLDLTMPLGYCIVGGGTTAGAELVGFRGSSSLG